MKLQILDYVFKISSKIIDMSWNSIHVIKLNFAEIMNLQIQLSMFPLQSLVIS